MGWCRLILEVDEENLGALLCCERHRSLVSDAEPVARVQHQIAKGALAINDVNPGNTPGHELMHHVMPWFQEGRADNNVLADPQRPRAPIG